MQTTEAAPPIASTWTYQVDHLDNGEGKRRWRREERRGGGEGEKRGEEEGREGEEEGRGRVKERGRKGKRRGDYD